MVEGQRRIRRNDRNSEWGRSRLRRPSTAVPAVPLPSKLGRIDQFQNAPTRAASAWPCA